MIVVLCGWCGRALGFTERCTCRDETLGIDVVPSVVCTAFEDIEVHHEEEIGAC